MQKINKNSAGIAVGLFFGLAHLGWAILVAINLAKPFMDWILGLHFMTLKYTMNPFSIVTALLLVIVTFVVGYVIGWCLSALWNKFVK